jgi:ribosomal protein S18 acetylase RimI-like enzyme
MARVHERAFPEYPLTRLGTPVIEKFYAEFCHHPFDHGVVARLAESGPVIAFVVGTSEPSRHFRAFYLRSLPAVIVGLLRRYSRDPTLREGIRRRFNRRNPGSRPDRMCPMRLLSIAVDPAYQGTGAARAVAGRFEAIVRGAGHSRLGLSVRPENGRAIAFYRKTGWEMTHRSEAGIWFEKGL